MQISEVYANGNTLTDPHMQNRLERLHYSIRRARQLNQLLRSGVGTDILRCCLCAVGRQVAQSQHTFVWRRSRQQRNNGVLFRTVLRLKGVGGDAPCLALCSFRCRQMVLFLGYETVFRDRH